MLTPFEITGVKTSLSDGEYFLEALAAAHPGWVTIERWGQLGGLTRLGMFSVTVGTGPVGAAILGSIHGDEVQGRETCFAFARDLAESTDPTVQAYLAEHSWSFMATANPWGARRFSRENQYGEDLNRNYDDLTQLETQAITAWLYWCTASVSVDLHEMTDADLLAETSTGTMNPAAGLPPMLPLGVELNTAIRDALIGGGFTYLPYTTYNLGTHRTDGHLRHKMVTELLELNSTRLPALGDRITAGLLALNATLDHHMANVDAYEAAQRAAGGGRPAAPPPPGSYRTVRGGELVPAAGFTKRSGVLVPL